MFDIFELRAKALLSVKEFTGTGEPLEEIGWGISGIVFLRRSLRTAIKIHHRSESYQTEIKAYQLLVSQHVETIHGLTIPRLISYSDRLLAIEMDFVSPPFLLDFAGVKFTDPGFTDETRKDIEDMIVQRFGVNSDLVYAVYHSLLKFGMHYMDLRPSNLNMQGLPGIVIDELDEL